MITMFQADTAFALGLIALAVGMALIVWMRMHREHTSLFCRGVAYLVVLLAFFVLFCTGYYSTKYWVEGYFTPQAMNQRCPMEKCRGMQGVMQNMTKENMDMKKMPMMDMQKQNMKETSSGCVGDQCQMQKKSMPQMKTIQKDMMQDKSMMKQNMGTNKVEYKEHHE